MFVRNGSIGRWLIALLAALGTLQLAAVAEEKKDAKPKAKPLPIAQFPVDVTDMVHADVQGKLTPFAPKAFKTNQQMYRLRVKLRNESDFTVPGPLTMYLHGTNIKGLHLRKPAEKKDDDQAGIQLADDEESNCGDDIKLADDDEDVDDDGEDVEDNKKAEEKEKVDPIAFSFLNETWKLEPKRTTKTVTMFFYADRKLTAKEIKDLKLDYLVLRKKAKTSELAPVINKDFVPGKHYTWKDQQRVLAVQKKFHKQLAGLSKDVNGTAVAENDNGELSVVVYGYRHGVSKLVPKQVGGVPVIFRVTSPVYAGPAAPKPNVPKPDAISGGGATIQSGAPTGGRNRFSRPVPIGVSISNAADGCYSGTLGCRCKMVDGGQIVGLSNNHVVGDNNDAIVGERIVQPSAGDNRCRVPTSNNVGLFRAFVPIDFTPGSENKVDAAIFNTTEELTAKNTPPIGGYGTPTSTPLEAFVDMQVQKVGRTTSCTTGAVTAIGYRTFVNYGAGRLAFFVDQVRISAGDGPDFSAGGDSGSLIVDEDRNPVALLFAGSGATTVGNRIQDVLELLEICIDGDGGGDPPPGGARIGDKVFVDVNQNGLQDEDELGLGGVTVVLQNPAGDTLQSTVTNSQGVYGFGVEPGTYRLKFTIPGEYDFTKADEGDDDEIDSDVTDTDNGTTETFVVEAETDDLTRDAGVVFVGDPKNAVVSDKVWYDVFRNGYQDRFERYFGLRNIRVTLFDADSGAPIATTRTNRRGLYRFTDLPVGNYFVRFNKPGWLEWVRQNVGSESVDSDVDPRTGQTDTFSLGRGEVKTDIDAGLQRREFRFGRIR